jgi:hypothetical protein
MSEAADLVVGVSGGLEIFFRFLYGSTVEVALIKAERPPETPDGRATLLRIAACLAAPRLERQRCD